MKRRIKLKKDFNKLTRKEKLDIYNVLSDMYLERCMICGAERKTRRLHIDHDHKSPRHVRGLLCHRCNRGLVWFSDEPERLESAAKYLRRTK